MDTILHGLNGAQSSAVTSAAPVLQILAPPGSGKTKTLTARVAYLLTCHGYRPWNIICCTFTIKASREMRSRLKSLIGEALEGKLLLGTFHSICYRYLKTYGHLLGKNVPKDFGIADSSDCLNILTRIIKRLNIPIDPKSIRARISKCKAKASDLEDRRHSTYGKKPGLDTLEFLQVYEDYENALAASKLLDYDDLLLRCAQLLREHPECVSNVEAVLIDEFQDTNVVQLQLMSLFANQNKRVTVVGDPDQSIYGFRSAEIQNLARMQQVYPDTLVINLEQNYRSSAALLRCAQEVIEQDTARPNKKLKATHCYGSPPVLRRLPSAHDEAKWIVSEIKRLKALTGNLTTFSDYAILLRSAHLSLLVEKDLGRAAMPYRMVGGYRFFDREEIRVLLDYLRTINQPNNNAALCAIINVPARKIGTESLKELMSVADEKHMSLWALIQKMSQGHLSLRKKLSKPAEQNVCKLVSFIKHARRRMAEVPAEWTAKFVLEFCIEHLKYKEYLQNRHAEDHGSRWANVEELIAECGSHGHEANFGQSLPAVETVEQKHLESHDEALSSFLANVTLSSDKTEDGQAQECITISTIHSAKGLEWPIVFIPAVYEGSIPHSRAEDADEERRLLYVAMTRAQALLYLSYPLRQSGGEAETKPSSFLPERLHRYLAALGPNITEEVIRDIASILQRNRPEEHKILEGMRGLSDRESLKDDLWPVDGSPKPEQWWKPEQAFSNSRKACLNMDERRDAQVIPQFEQDMQVDESKIRTTMTSSSSVTMANRSVGFSTATEQLKLGQSFPINGVATSTPTESSTRSDAANARRKGSKSRSLSGQGTIKDFFGHGSQMCKQSAMAQPSQYAENAATTASDIIPATLVSRKVSTEATSLKRRQPLQGDGNAKRREYFFLYSSPSRENHLEKYSVDANSFNAKTSTGQENYQNASAVKSASTMHTTSMDMVREQYLAGRKTYGVRRMMNGWENRKNK